MPHDVFISYATPNQNIADACCHYLEAAGIRAWIAPRDIVAGTKWGEAIVDGINEARVVVLVFSGHANESQMVNREVELAVSHGLPILPFRIEDVPPSKAMEFFIGPHHWLDAITPPMERHILILVDTVRLHLERAAARDGGAPSAPHVPHVPRRESPRNPALAEAASLAARWAEAGHPYYLVESLGPELKGLVVNPPFDAAPADAETEAFLLLSSLHYGSSWAFWVRRNAGNPAAVQHVVKTLGLAYIRPRLRAICALQLFPAALLAQAAAELGGALDPRIRKVLEQVVLPGKAQEYLQRIIDGEDRELGKKAAAVLRELQAAAEPEGDDLLDL